MPGTPNKDGDDPASIVGGEPLILTEQAAKLRAESRAAIERCHAIFRRVDEVIAESEHVISEIHERQARTPFE